MTARILGDMSGTLLAMFWTWRNLNEFSTMTVKEVAKICYNNCQYAADKINELTNISVKNLVSLLTSKP